MKDSDKKKIEIAVIAVCLVIMLFRFLQPKPVVKDRPMPEIFERRASFVPGAKDSNLSDNISNIGQSVIERKDLAVKHVRDIFQKPAELNSLENKPLYGPGQAPQNANQQALVLEGIIWGADNNIAIVSGVVLREGDMVSDAKVLKIDSDKVVLLQNGSQFELKR